MTPEDCQELLESAPIDSESVTYLLVAGAPRAQVAAAVGADLSRQLSWTEDDLVPDEQSSAYAFAEVAGGVVAMEPSGFAGPTLDTLRQLSAGGRTAAVAGSNILGHCRFGYARDGEVVFDENEYAFVDDLHEVPEEVRPIAARAWSVGEEDSELDWLTGALAMALQVTGLRLTAETLERAAADGFYAAPALAYSPE